MNKKTIGALLATLAIGSMNIASAEEKPAGDAAKGEKAEKAGKKGGKKGDKKADKKADDKKGGEKACGGDKGCSGAK